MASVSLFACHHAASNIDRHGHISVPAAAYELTRSNGESYSDK